MNTIDSMHEMVNSAVVITHLTSHCVYLLLRRGEIVYIGKGTSIGRAIESFRQKNGQLSKKKKCDEIKIIMTASNDAASELERDMIIFFEPELNVTIPRYGNKPGGILPRVKREREKSGQEHISILNEMTRARDFEKPLSEADVARLQLCVVEAQYLEKSGHELPA